MAKNYNDFVKKELEKERIRKQLTSNTDYVEWLLDFTKYKDSFADDDWDYSIEKLNEEDQSRVDNLSLFFEGIYSYARRNYIPSCGNQLGEFHQIVYNGVVLEIGYMTGQGTYFYCKRNAPQIDTAIDFIDIVNNKKQDNVDYIESSIEDLANRMINLHNSGVPIDAIDIAIDKAYKHISQVEKEAQRVMRMNSN